MLKASKVKKIIKDIVSGYIGFIIVLFLAQSFFIYHPTTFKEYNIKSVDGINGIIVKNKNIEWLFLPSHQPSNKFLIYFHGNAGSAIDRVWKSSVWRDAGFNIVLAEYPGYGTNAGSPSEEDNYNAGRIIIDKTSSDFPKVQLYIYGESIGSGVAVQMASEYNEKALIIESGFSSLSDVVKSKFPFIPVSMLLKDKYDSLSKINKIKSRLVLIHGKKDKVVPYYLGVKLFDHYEGDKKIISVDGAGHNDVYSYVDLFKTINMVID